MTTIHILSVCSIALNAFLIWYIIKILKKFVYISDNLADLFLTIKAFQVFVSSMYSMESFYGEPMIQELVMRIKDVSEEMEMFRDVFEYSLDAELEEELDATPEDPTPLEE
tara:strand:+ start:3403 stop:3735 length:333 start_codon:yes stop_codon:yes gene_type:complete